MIHSLVRSGAVLSALVVCGAILLLTGCETTDSGGKAQAPQPRMGSDVLRVGDPLLISFTGVADPPETRHEERIKEDGMVTLPYLKDPIQAAGRSRKELEQAIHDAYVPKYYTHLTVVVGSESRFFYVDGQVKNPNRYQFAGEMNVSKCITAAGGFTDFAKKTNIEVIHSNGHRETVNWNEAQRNPSKDIAIYPDDKIYVKRRYF